MLLPVPPAVFPAFGITAALVGGYRKAHVFKLCACPVITPEKMIIVGADPILKVIGLLPT